MLNSGKATNQHVPHVQLHVIPRRHGDTSLVLRRYLAYFINPWSQHGREQRLARQKAVWRDLFKTI